MLKLEKLSDVAVTITSGQIMSRVTCNPAKDEEVVEERHVVVPKSIHSDGSVDFSEMPVENLKVPADPKKVTEIGDIVIKLSTPYDAGIITEETAGCLIPSFCAIIKNTGALDKNYLLAFLNSSRAKNQLNTMVKGSVMTVLSVGKLGDLVIPMIPIEQQSDIGDEYINTTERLSVIRQIMALEAKKNDIVFRDMEKNYD